MSRIVILSGILLMLFSGCAKRKVRKQAAIDEEIITQYLDDNSINATATGSGLYYVIDSTSNSTVYAESTSYVTVAYKGYYIDGSTFDQSPGSGSNFSLQGVIAGWREGIPLFPKGSIGRLFIPSHLGYGLKDYGDIPGASVLIFDVEVIDVQ